MNLKQLVTESNQVFKDNVITAIYENTKGQPGLVCALCSYIVENLTEAEKIANNMLKMKKFSIEQICQATGVNIDRMKLHISGSGGDSHSTPIEVNTSVD